MRDPQNILITGGSGFIGSNLIRYILDKTCFSGRIINYDKLTYAGNPYNLKDIEERELGKRYFFCKADICDQKKLQANFKEFDIDTVIHLAAESHVDRSITGPAAFIETNINGTFSLLTVAKEEWGRRKDVLFHHVSTDEVFGSLGPSGYFTEETAYNPRSPYSASKAASDHLVRAFHHTYNLPVTLSNCSNNYGPYQFPEKLIPVIITNLLEGKPLPVYGEGKNIRDWLYVEDHCDAIWTIVTQSPVGETYNIGGENEWENIKLVQLICELMSKETSVPVEIYLKSISFVTDRLGHDHRYAIDMTKVKKSLNWNVKTTFEEGILKTIKWYLSQQVWIKNIKSGKYQNEHI